MGRLVIFAICVIVGRIVDSRSAGNPCQLLTTCEECVRSPGCIFFVERDSFDGTCTAKNELNLKSVVLSFPNKRACGRFRKFQDAVKVTTVRSVNVLGDLSATKPVHTTMESFMHTTTELFNYGINHSHTKSHADKIDLVVDNTSTISPIHQDDYVGKSTPATEVDSQLMENLHAETTTSRVELLTSQFNIHGELSSSTDSNINHTRVKTHGYNEILTTVNPSSVHHGKTGSDMSTENAFFAHPDINANEDTTTMEYSTPEPVAVTTNHDDVAFPSTIGIYTEEYDYSALQNSTETSVNDFAGTTESELSRISSTEIPHYVQKMLEHMRNASQARSHAKSHVRRFKIRENKKQKAFRSMCNTRKYVIEYLEEEALDRAKQGKTLKKEDQELWMWNGINPTKGNYMLCDFLRTRMKHN